MRYQALWSKAWIDERFSGLSDAAKLLFLYIMSSPHSNSIGLFLLPKKYIECDLNWDGKRLAEPFAELLRERLILYDEPTRLILVVNHLKYNPIQNENQSKAAVNIVNSLPRIPIEFSGILERLAKPFHKPLRERLQERLQERFGEGYAYPETKTKTLNRNKNFLSGTSVPSSSSADADSDPQAPEPDSDNGKKSRPDCPVSKIVDSYHTNLPEFSQVKFIDKTTRANVRNRWAEDPARWDLDWWGGLFQYIGESDFLSGRKTDFKASFNWIMGPKNFTKILNGAYNNNRALPERTQRNLSAADQAKQLVKEGLL